MKFFVDSADISEIRELAAAGFVDGVTTNPSLISKTSRPIRDVIKEICGTIEGPVSAEVTATDFDGMIAEGERLASIAANVVVKVPSTWDGFRACRVLARPATRSMSRCAFPQTRHCLRPRRVRRSFRPSSAGSTTSDWTAWKWSGKSAPSTTMTHASRRKSWRLRYALHSMSKKRQSQAPILRPSPQQYFEALPNTRSPTRVWRPSSRTGARRGKRSFKVAQAGCRKWPKPLAAKWTNWSRSRCSGMTPSRQTGWQFIFPRRLPTRRDAHQPVERMVLESNTKNASNCSLNSFA